MPIWDLEQCISWKVPSIVKDNVCHERNNDGALNVRKGKRCVTIDKTRVESR